MIEVRGLTKRFGRTVAVNNLSFDVQPGRVTGFLGPNGSGKSTSMRCMLALDRADAGTATFDGRRYESMRKPLFEVGALLDAGYVHPGRQGRNHLRMIAASNGIEQRADLEQRFAHRFVSAAVEGRSAGVGAIEREHAPHRGALARAIRTEEPGDTAGLHIEAEIVDRNRTPEPFGEAADLDHEPVDSFEAM